MALTSRAASILRPSLRWRPRHARLIGIADVRAATGKFTTLDAITKREQLDLDSVVDKVHRVKHWITNEVTELIMSGEILLHSPIVARCYQELTDGTVAESARACRYYSGRRCRKRLQLCWLFKFGC